ncbi:MAG TPA: hypothetical protein VFE51_03275 [Verrucomicrobiae bacterium]|nr:hypothetical protein [Verrucomicrobiae bacterium]
MSRGVTFLVCAIVGLVLLACGLIIPAHLRAVDSSVLKKAGEHSISLVARGLELTSQNQLGAAQLLSLAARQERLPTREKLEFAVDELARQHPAWVVWGGPEPHFESIFQKESGLRDPGSDPFTEYVIRLENRQRVLGILSASHRPAVQQLLQVRSLTNTVLFPPSSSAAGQPLDAALSICGLLMEGGHLASGLSNSVFTYSTSAVHGESTQPLEQVLLDFMSLGQRFNWGQLVTFVQNMPDPETLRLEGDLVRRSASQLPVLFAVVELSGRPADVAHYLMDFSQTGITDLGRALAYGAGGLNELLTRDQRLDREAAAYYFPFEGLKSAAAGLSWQSPWFALTLKWILYLAAGFLLAFAVHFALPSASALEQPLQVRGFHVAREMLFALGFLLVVLLLSEPFLSQESQRVEFPIRLSLSTVGKLVPTGAASAKSLFMNQLSLLTLLLFFVLQGLIYIACVFKLAEIRRQRVPPRFKLRLLENEEHLFDAGLYLGFVGTIISLILVSLNIIQFSLMAAYSSTSFGIIFVSFFKIFNLRPARRKLLLEAESMTEEPVAPGARPSFATPS